MSQFANPIVHRGAVRQTTTETESLPQEVGTFGPNFFATLQTPDTEAFAELATRYIQDDCSPEDIKQFAREVATATFTQDLPLLNFLEVREIAVRYLISQRFDSEFSALDRVRLADALGVKVFPFNPVWADEYSQHVRTPFRRGSERLQDLRDAIHRAYQFD